MKTTSILVIVSLLVMVASCHPLSPALRERVLFQEDFDPYPDGSALPDHWWHEGSNAVRIEKGHLRADANLDHNGEDYDASTVWLNKTFTGDLRVEFDAHVLASEGDKNNINFFFLFSDSSGTPLSQTRDERTDGKYGKYHKLSGYVFTFLANGNSDKARFRWRDDPDFHLLQENFAYECKQNKTYHIAITKQANRITYAVDGTIYLDKIDNVANPEHNSGIIGFRTWHTDVWWDNLKVMQL
jgi:hypothetical protein